MGSYGVRPFMHRGGPALSSHDDELLEQRIALNRQVPGKFWNGDVDDNEGCDRTGRLGPGGHLRTETPPKVPAP